MLRPRRPHSSAKSDRVPETIFDRDIRATIRLRRIAKAKMINVRAYCSASLLKFSLRFKLQLKRQQKGGFLK
jgi:hypothetical protein